MKRLLFLLALLLSASPAAAQYVGVNGCGTPPATLKAGVTYGGFVDINTGNVCTNATSSGGATSVSINQSGSVVSSANPLWVQSSSSIPVIVSVNAPPNDVTAGPTGFSGTGTLSVNSQGSGAVGVQATGNGGGLAFSFQANDDGSNWFSINCFTTAGAIVTSGTANGNWVCPVAGYKNVRINLTAITSGTETFTLNASAGSIQHVLTAQGVAADIRSFGGTAVSTGTGAGGSGIPRVTVSNDSSLAANQSVNISQINAQTAANGGATGSLLVEQGCAGQTVANTSVAVINVASTTVTKLVTKATSKNVYICGINLVSATAQNVALIAGTLTTNQCDTSTAGLAGGTTAATGWNLAANGGLTAGNGQGVLFKTASTGLDVCIVSSSTGQISGTLTWAQF